MQPELQVSQSTTGNQSVSGVAIDRASRFVVTWIDDASSSSYACFGQLFDEEGDPVPSQFQIDPSTAHQYFGDVAKDRAGKDGGIPDQDLRTRPLLSRVVPRSLVIR